MKRNLLVLSLLGLLLASCGNSNNSSINSNSNDSDISISASESIIEEVSSEEFVFVDYASKITLDLQDSSKVYAKVRVYNFVDGDTTHFIPVETPTKWISDADGILKARYNSVDTPESTGKVEPWGKAAAKFTKEKLSSAKSIIIQSDDENWNTDSTGERYLVWVWYQLEDGAPYRLLNLELIQNGLAKLKSSTNYSLSETFNAANMQAMVQGIKVYGTDKDPDYYYGNAQVITMKELRTNYQEYANTKVSVNCLVTVYDAMNHMVYAQEYDDEDGKWYGMSFYCGFNNYKILKPGNYVRLVGTLQYYETGGSWQVSGLTYMPLDPDYEGSMKLIEQGVEVQAQEITRDDLFYEYYQLIEKPEDGDFAFNSGVTYYESDSQSYVVTKDSVANQEKDYYFKVEPAQSTYVTMSNLTVTDTYTTNNEASSSNGAITLTCKDEDGKEVIVRTSVLKNPDKSIITADVFDGKVINVKGIVCTYEGNPQIHLFDIGDVEFVEE